VAFGAKKIYPIDTKPSVAVGIGLPFNGPAVFNSTYLTKDAIKANLINFFLTNPYERYLNNRFGAGLRAFIFEQITNDNTEFLKDNIQTQLNQFFSNINVVSLDIFANNDSNSINVVLTYSIPNTDISDVLEITF
jgi:hypothetical protein